MIPNSDLQRHVGKFYGKYSGEVTDNVDAEKRGNIKVKVASVFGPDMEVPARPCLPFGHFFVPDVGAKIWVEFEAGDTRFPIWVGVWYPTDSTPKDAAISPPDNRVIQTPSGHTIEILDKAGEEKILIKHKGNAFLTIDKDGSVLIANQKGSHIFLDANGGKVTVMEQHSNLITMTDAGITIVSADGSTVELKKDLAHLIAKNIILDGQSVALGPQAMAPTIMADPAFLALWTAFMVHTHVTALGPSGPPVPPPPALAPGSHLSSAVLVK